MKKGFALIELVIIMAILGIISYVAIPEMNARIEKERAKKSGVTKFLSPKTCTCR